MTSEERGAASPPVRQRGISEEARRSPATTASSSTSSGQTEKPESSPESPQTPPRKPRRSRKRTRFAVPQQPAKSVKALWQEASEEERTKAHEIGMLILETWLGKKSRKDAATELGLPVLRFWQLSQQAVSGMLAGLLIQPRTRRSPALPKPAPEDDPVELRKEIAKLERELKSSQDLIEVLKLIPGRPEAPPEREKKPKSKKKASPRGSARPATSAKESKRAPTSKRDP